MGVDTKDSIAMNENNYLLNNLEVGNRFKLWYGRGNINNKTFEVRAIVDGSYIVLKQNLGLGRCRYWIETIDFLLMSADYLKRVK
jgi:hypothetical protein